MSSVFSSAANAYLSIRFHVRRQGVDGGGVSLNEARYIQYVIGHAEFLLLSWLHIIIVEQFNAYQASWTYHVLGSTFFFCSRRKLRYS